MQRRLRTRRRNSQKINGVLDEEDVKKATKTQAPTKERKEWAECGAEAEDAAEASGAA